LIFCFCGARRFPRLNNKHNLSFEFSSAFARLAVALVCVAIAFALAGCGKRTISKSELRSITVEVTTAAQKITGSGARVEIRPQPASSQTGVPAGPGFDEIYISLAEAKQAPVLRDALASIAAHHELTVSTNTFGAVTRYDYSFRGARTHSIHVVTPLALRPPHHAALKPLTRQAKGGPRLAIIIDDMGYDRAASDSVLALNFPLTVSVLPNLPLSGDVAEEAHRRGDQVMLHLPMQSEGEDAKSETVELRVGMRAPEVNQILSGALESVPHVAGVNNHQGSLATSNAALMAELMPALRQRGLFFIDSRTEKTTVAYDAAKKAGVRAASRRVFLDDVATREAVIAQLRLAAKDAQRDGYAIAIGHPKPATIAALSEEAQRLEASGIDFVFASDLVQ
jgi:uncharacterized protein